MGILLILFVYLFLYIIRLINNENYCFKLFVIGRSTWKLLHTIAATYPNKPSAEIQSDIQKFISLLPKVYPCEICANDFAEMLVFLFI